jgi:hypothetical protein
MKKHSLFKRYIIASTCILSSQEGAAGIDNTTIAKYGLVPFISAEASATQDTTTSVNIFGNSPSRTSDPWGGRGAIGVTLLYTQLIKMSAEMGWGYFTHTTSHSVGTSPNGALHLENNNTSYNYGFDLLAGASYAVNPFDVYLKVGAMALNRHFQGHTQSSTAFNTLSFSQENTQTNVFPEIKVGGLYHLKNNWDFTLAYMHVFGNSNLNASINGTPTNPVTPGNLTASSSFQNPSLDSVMFGLVYNFA